jgi:hypothetical protein
LLWLSRQWSVRVWVPDFNLLPWIRGLQCLCPRSARSPRFASHESIYSSSTNGLPPNVGHPYWYPFWTYEILTLTFHQNAVCRLQQVQTSSICVDLIMQCAGFSVCDHGALYLACIH